MAFGNTVEDAGSIPIAETYVPGVGFVALQGSTLTNTDGSSNKSSPANFNLTQINSIAAQMAGTDAVTAANVLEIVQALYNGATVDMLRSSAAGDGLTVGVGAYSPYLYNGASEDRARGNLDNITLLASGVVTSNSQSADQTNYNAKGVKVYIKTGSFGASESTMVVNVQIKDPVNSTYYTVLTSASLTASTTYVLTVYPGVTVAANLAISDVIPRTWRVNYTASNWGTGGSTLAIACAYIL